MAFERGARGAMGTARTEPLQEGPRPPGSLVPPGPPRGRPMGNGVKMDMVNERLIGPNPARRKLARTVERFGYALRS